MRIALLRHAPTAGNLAHRYVGATDEDLGPQGEALARAAAEGLAGLSPARVFTSGMARCEQTARLALPGQRTRTLPGLAEMDFGAFEGKTYLDLSGDPRYQAWVDSGCTDACPGGENRAGFVDRVCATLGDALGEIAHNTSSQTERDPGRHSIDALFVVHAGTIMAAMSSMAVPYRDYWDWKAPFCCGFAAQARQTEMGWQLFDVGRIGAGWD